MPSVSKASEMNSVALTIQGCPGFLFHLRLFLLLRVALVLGAWGPGPLLALVSAALADTLVGHCADSLAALDGWGGLQRPYCTISRSRKFWLLRLRSVLPGVEHGAALSS